MAFSNILFISIEDLNDWIEPLKGHPDTVTPNLKRLANKSSNFKNAFANVPACSPSRSATLFSRSPITTGIVTNQQKWYDFYDEETKTSIFGELKKAGYECYLRGKIFHPPKRYPIYDIENDFRGSDYIENILPCQNISKTAAARNTEYNKFDFGIDRSNRKTGDDESVEFIINQIKKDSFKKVWACGIYKPHLPFYARQEFFDMIPKDVHLPLGMLCQNKPFDPNNYDECKNIAPIAGSRISRRADGFSLKANGEYNDFLRSYLACINYADHLVGKLLDKLEETQQIDKTLIVLWSDHGWQLGEKLCFRKFTLWERALRIPVMFSGPSIKIKNIKTPFSLIDLSPTILDLMNVKIPEYYEGKSFKNELMFNNTKATRNSVTSIWCLGQTPKNLHKKLKGVTIREKNYRYILYSNGEEELYKHPEDKYEHNNLLSENNKDINKNFDENKIKKLRNKANTVMNRLSKRLKKIKKNNLDLKKDDLNNNKEFLLRKTLLK